MLLLLVIYDQQHRQQQHLDIYDVRYTTFFLIFFDKMAVGGHFGWTTMSIIELVRDIWTSNACVKFEERSLNPSKLSR